LALVVTAQRLALVLGELVDQTLFLGILLQLAVAVAVVKAVVLLQLALLEVQVVAVYIAVLVAQEQPVKGMQVVQERLVQIVGLAVAVVELVLLVEMQQVRWLAQVVMVSHLLLLVLL
jgi:hypothetical protein